MNMISVVVSIAATVAIYVTMIMGLTYGSSLAFAQGNQSFIINLNGSQEVHQYRPRQPAWLKLQRD